MVPPPPNIEVNRILCDKCEIPWHCPYNVPLSTYHKTNVVTLHKMLHDIIPG